MTEEQSTPAPLVPAVASGAVYFFAPFRLDLQNEQLWRGKRLIALQPKTFTVLCYLAEHPQRLLTKEELLDALWGGLSVGEAVLKTHVREIRQALGDTAKKRQFVETVHGRGYRFIAAIRSHTAAQQKPTPPRVSALPPTFVGRQEELLRLEHLLDRVRVGARHMAFVTGEPGIGKTMLLNTFLAPLKQSNDVWIAWGQCIEQYGAGAAYLPVLEALGRLSRGRDASHVVDVLRRAAPTWLVQMPELVDPDSLIVLERSTAAATPERMLRELAEAIPLLTELRPLVLLLEDLHWADYSTLDLLSYLGKRADPARLLVLATFRSAEVRMSEHPLWAIQQGLQLHEQCEEISLQHLRASDVSAYLDARFIGHEFPSALARVVHEHTAGNPLFMVRVVDSLLKQGSLSKAQGQWQLCSDLAAVRDGVPESVAAMIEQETERLTEFERGVLEVASTVGAEVSPALVAAALGTDVLLVEALCARWVRRGRFLKSSTKIESPGARSALFCEFIHAVYRQVIYERIGPLRRKQLHQRLGEIEEASAGKERQASADELALHFERSEDLERAVRYRRLAGEQALRKSAYREAIEHFTRARELLTQLAAGPPPRAPGFPPQRLELELCVSLGVPLAMTQGYASPEVEQVYVRAAQLCEELGETLHSFPVMSGIAVFYLMRGLYEKCLELGHRFLTVADNHGDQRAKLEACHVLGAAYATMGKYQNAERYLGQVLRHYSSDAPGAPMFSYHQDPFVPAQGYMAWVLWVTGYADRALARLQEARRVAEATMEPLSIATALLNLCLVHQWRRESDQAQACAETLAALSRRQGFIFLVAVATEATGVALAQSGQIQAGIELLQRGWAAHRATGSEYAKAYWRINLSEACIKLGLFDEAESVLDEASQCISQHGEGMWEPELFRIYGELCRRAPERASGSRAPAFSDLTGAEAAFERAIEIARQRGARSQELRAAVDLARLWTSQQQSVRAQRLLAPIYAAFTEGHATGDLLEARQLLDELRADS